MGKLNIKSLLKYVVIVVVILASGYGIVSNTDLIGTDVVQDSTSVQDTVVAVDSTVVDTLQ